MSAVYKMIDTLMLQNGFETGFKFGKKSQEIIEPISIPIKGARYGLGYIRTDDDMKMKKNSDKAFVKPIPHWYQWIPVREYADRDSLRDEICNLFEKINVVKEEEVQLAGICDVELGKMLQNRTSTPILIPQTPW